MHFRTSPQTFVKIHYKKKMGYIQSLECAKKKPQAHSQSAQMKLPKISC